MPTPARTGVARDAGLREHAGTPLPLVPIAMPRPFLRRLYLGVLFFVALLGVVVVAIYVSSQRRLDHDYALHVAVGAPDPALAVEGRHLAQSRGCADCHADDYAGKVLLDEMPFGRIAGSNLTRMPAGHAKGSMHERVYRALHHGVDMDSRPLLMMPSKEFGSLSAHEIEAIAAYLASLKPIDRALPESKLGPLGRTLLVAGKLPDFLSAEIIDHDSPAVAEPPPIGTLAYGRHVAQLCTGCHRADYAGGPMSHGPPTDVPAANLTPGKDLAGWSERDFLIAMRTGKRPDGSSIDGTVMPWRAVGRASDAELQSLWLFLRSLPPVDRGAGQKR